ncbi:MAG: DUF6438 domain-containing protein [Flavobacteriales bacterium]
MKWIYSIGIFLWMISCFVNPKKESKLISIEKTPCKLECPTYVITINKDKTVHYKGIKNVSFIGEKEFSLTESQFQELESKLADFSFEKYSSSYGGTYTDVPSILITTPVKTIKLVRKKGPMELYKLVEFIENQYIPKK